MALRTCSLEHGAWHIKPLHRERNVRNIDKENPTDFICDIRDEDGNMCGMKFDSFAKLVTQGQVEGFEQKCEKCV